MYCSTVATAAIAFENVIFPSSFKLFVHMHYIPKVLLRSQKILKCVSFVIEQSIGICFVLFVLGRKSVSGCAKVVGYACIYFSSDYFHFAQSNPFTFVSSSSSSSIQRFQSTVSSYLFFSNPLSFNKCGQNVSPLLPVSFFVTFFFATI